MDFGLSSEQQQLADAERSWLTRNDPIARARAMLERSPVTVDPDAVSHAAEGGLLALLTPEVDGGHVDLAVLAEAHGYAASSLPIADLAVAAWLLEVSGSPQAPAAAQGEALFGLTRAPATLTGPSSPVPMAADMAGVVVVGETDEGDYLSVMTNPRLEPMSTLDLSRSWARVAVDPGETGRLPLPSGTAGFVRDALAVHRGVDALGAAARLLEMTVVYAGQRQQFGVPIGSFQAVKHHCANMALAVEAGRSTLWAGALTLDTAAPAAQRSRAASSAAAYAKAAAAEVAGTALQVHGGIGFTWEHDLHLLLRRIKVDEAMDGTVAEHRAALVAG
ncbi:acyl-CoA dehydrogenase domain-containing protein [Mycobacterium europaeum]|uniref:Acyl-CoA dehydrogenase domain-containing protein n=1 Tax=Mycobacterium europaeum TaxID=761804 RepID=A0A0U1DLJ4_9MYCO|nr:acyl-CoA dehydrogenase family protein [Mycobacterium europaeum]CQD18832.1 acyl-CoA dehydrogenase domain-containing protein [Mycobacterium europaeum]